MYSKVIDVQAQSFGNFRIFSCSLNGDPAPESSLHVYVSERESKRIEGEAGWTVFDKLIKKTSGDFVVRAMFGIMEPAKEGLFDGKYQYDARAKKLVVEIAGQKFDLVYDYSKQTMFTLMSVADKNSQLICAASK